MQNIANKENERKSSWLKGRKKSTFLFLQEFHFYHNKCTVETKLILFDVFMFCSFKFMHISSD